MPRTARVVMPGLPHHVSHRGNRRAMLFFDSQDYQRYLELLALYSRRHCLRVLAYCLMPDHVHLLVLPTGPGTLARCVRDTHQVYAAYLNQATGDSGHLWQGRYHSCVIEPACLLEATRRVENNPVRAGITNAAHEYPWSSAPAHAGLRADPVLVKRWPRSLPRRPRARDWRAWLADERDEAFAELLRKRTIACTACGSPAFIRDLERRCGRRLTPGRRGRPPRSPDARPGNN